MNLKKMFLNVYEPFFQNKDLLGEGSAFLTVEPEAVLNEEGEMGPLKNLAEEQLIKVINLFLGGRDVAKENECRMAEYVIAQYKDQEYWRDLILDFLEYRLEKEHFELLEEQKSLLAQTKETLKEILFIEAQEKKVIQSFADRVKKEGFKVNAEKLIANYLKMCKQDKEEAWRILITNPALFSPIIVTNEKGKVCLSPKAAQKENERLAQFLKQLRL